ncbi:SAM-dependent methyltransferase [Winogradskyella sp. PC-19]|uniref:class I SAM-dependent methyltransferase n=1 Tax=unclassified Winogradskyella TaxID=2615021 RepID=UPI000B3C86A3|nr:MULTISPECIES: class I SAM-dependent methyltransferase [unclassified Winogradskyella]ARV08668.1 SAM-dependent methyltransferase [Winogradskyella sp. PC-19]RZN76445.1 MAG: class I SAM-dependent methyltransferase [Winogradskyella sp.]
MNLSILNTEVQAYIAENLKQDISKLLLKSISFPNVGTKKVIEQIEAKKRSEKKLPTWFHTKNIYYPNKLNIEQTSSEVTANYKASLVSGKSLIDLTGGFGVDAFYYSKQINKVTHCEINAELSELVKHNYKALNISNIECINDNGIDTLKRLDNPFDWIYLDPSRRDDSKKKVFLLSDCSPNVKTFQGLFLKYAKQVMIKTSPLLDIKATHYDLKFVKELHIVAVDNEVKELLWILERDYESDFRIITVNLSKDIEQKFEFNFENESSSLAEYSEPLTYLYEPNSAILKAGAFNSISTNLNLPKLHKHSHLYTSEKLVDFPGRRFKIENIIPFNKKQFAKEKISKANVTTRNFPLSVGDIRKKLKIKDGGNTYLFFTTNKDEEKVIIICSKT